MTDDAAVLLIDARHEARDILDSHDRDIEAVAETHEASTLLRSIDVERASEHLRLISDESDCASSHASEADDDVLGEVRSNLEEVLMVADWLDDILDVIRDVWIRRNDTFEFVTFASDLVGHRVDRRILHVVVRQEADEFADSHEALLVAVAHELAHARLGRVNVGSTEGLLVALLLSDLLHHVRTCDEHLSFFAHHEDEVGQCWRIARAACAWAHDGTDLRDHARSLHIAVEDVAEARERLDAFLDTCTTRVVETDDRSTVLKGSVLHLGNLGSVGSRE